MSLDAVEQGSALAEFMRARGHDGSKSPLRTALEEELKPAAPAPAKAPPSLSLMCKPAGQTLIMSAGEGCMSSFFMPVPIAHPQQDKKELTNVTRYGRIHKRKRPSRTLGYMAQHCPPGTRYCTDCKKPMPENAFYPFLKRNVCRRHHYEQVVTRSIVRYNEQPLLFLADRAWFLLQEYWPLLGGPTRMNYDAHDVKDLIDNLKIPISVKPRFVPIDPARPMRPRNIAIVGDVQFHVLMKIAYNTSSRAQHILFAQSVNLVPPHADVGIPWNPFHDPDYRRVDIDVTPIIEEERGMQIAIPCKDYTLELQEEAARRGALVPPPLPAEGFPGSLVVLPAELL